jgi:hypothetical protein
MANEAVTTVGAAHDGPRTFDQMRDFFEFLEREVPVLVESWHCDRVRGHEPR